VSCIDVTIMDRSAHRALPSPYSKLFPAFRSGAAVTHAAGLGGKRFIDLRKPHACVSALVLQHGSKCTPSGIEHRLGLNGSGPLGLPGALCAGQGRLPVAVETLGIDRRAIITEGCKALQSQIDPDARDRAIEDRDPDSGGARTVHPYSIPKRPPITPRQTSRNAGHRRHAPLRVSLSLARLKAGVPRGD
jgi:hypothetical protein